MYAILFRLNVWARQYPALACLFILAVAVFVLLLPFMLGCGMLSPDACRASGR